LWLWREEHGVRDVLREQRPDEKFVIQPNAARHARRGIRRAMTAMTAMTAALA
jgi:hypothetical protein